jgi:ABC-type cobalamin/Fe3+-siderophores transport system ATPase subunit
MIEISQVTVIRDELEIISNFSATFPTGTISAIIGPNGTGKSTLLLALAGDLPIQNGEIKIHGSKVNEYSILELAKLRGVVLQQPNFNLAFTVSEIMAMARTAGSTAVSENQALRDLAISELADRKVTELSGGEKQRVALALALCVGAQVLLLDEPFAAQDGASKERIIELLKSEAKAGKTVILVAHLPKQDLVWCDQIIDNLG